MFISRCNFVILDIVMSFRDNYYMVVIQFGALYLDLKKAFDSVPHQRLLLKLKSNGILGNVLKWITNFLTNQNPNSLLVKRQNDNTSPGD